MNDERMCLPTRKPLCKAVDSPECRLPIEMKVQVIFDLVHVPGYKGSDGVKYIGLSICI